MHRCGGFFWLWYGERTEPGNENESRAHLHTGRGILENAAAVTRIGQEKPRKMAVFHISGYFQIPPMMSETSPPAITQVIPNPLGKMGTIKPGATRTCFRSRKNTISFNSLSGLSRDGRARGARGMALCGSLTRHFSRHLFQNLVPVNNREQRLVLVDDGNEPPWLAQDRTSEIVQCRVWRESHMCGAQVAA